MKEYIGKSLRELPKNVSLKGIRFKIPDNVKFLPKERRLEEAYIVSLHANGTGMFLAREISDGEIHLFPAYPPTRESILEWIIVDVVEKV